MLPQEVIRTKRDGLPLTPAAIAGFVAGIADGSVGEGQAAAFAMAVLLRGMTMDERVALTLALRDSGTVLDWRAMALPGPVLDKHSTGGVGDKTSLLVAPLIAACGGFVPMVSGRGLGHTGGTLDKMDAISGYQSQPGLDRLRATVADAGCAIIGATDDIAPADRRLYAIRDVTGTVESIDLITASILSKKLAAGLDGLVLDVKFGSGAFMPERPRARRLAASLAGVANAAGLPCIALLTDMAQVLGSTAGNALEVRECLDILIAGRAAGRLWTVTRALAAEMLVLGRLAGSLREAGEQLDRALASGQAAERFQRMVADLGGPADLLERPGARLRRAAVQRPVPPPEAARIGTIDARALGLAIVSLGGGRTRVDDRIDHAVGLSEMAGPGDLVEPGGRPICVVHAATDEAANAAATAVRAAVQLCDPRSGTPSVPKNPVAGRVAGR
jgi:thymidine phosphorylase